MMESNEISVSVDVKLDIYDKRPESLNFKTWTKCEVKMEAVKCLPCFLRITIQSQDQDHTQPPFNQLNIKINVPGVSLSLATSRTKQFSYGLFWNNHRRDCFIYFAADTETECRRHMKWIKKSIKNLEIYRQVFFEQRRNSRYPGSGGGALQVDGSQKLNKKAELSSVKDALSSLGPLPQIPITNNSFNWSGITRASRASDIYEEIFEGNVPPHLPRRLSRASIASGIYEEMKPCSQSIIDAIVEEQLECPPPLPPLPPHRKRMNTFGIDSSSSHGDLPRSNTNPESDLAKKKKYKNVLDNIFGSGRSKRAESVSETQACTMEDIINGGSSDNFNNPIYTNDILKNPEISNVMGNKRNSFSSPDLSKINFLDTFDEEKIAALLSLQKSTDDLEENDDLNDEHTDLANAEVHNYSSLSLDDSSIGHSTSRAILKRLHVLKSKSGSMESLNISEQIPQNFNFSACNTSSINLVGSSGAVPSLQKLKKNNIVIEDDLTGYCVMAPIQKKKTENCSTNATATSSTTSSTSSGYSTGSYCSTTSSSSCSSNTNSSEQKKDLKPELAKNQNSQPIQKLTKESDYDLVPLRKTPIPVNNDSNNIYENMQSGSPINVSIILKPHEQTPPLNKDFSGNLYENLLTIKAAQELEQPLPGNVCTSTPTEMSGEKDNAQNSMEEQENYYQTPRKSIISIDDKVPSYYPNSCDTMKMKRGSISPSKPTTPQSSLKSDEKEKSSNNLGLKHLVNIKMKRERKENLYISSPQKILEQRKKSISQSDTSAGITTLTRRSQNAQKISDNVYTVNLNKRKSLMLSSSNNNNNNNNTEKSSYNEENDAAHINQKLQTELLQLALLQNIDFKFDDTSDTHSGSITTSGNSPASLTTQSGIKRLEEAELEYENCYRATKDATRLLNKYATLAPKQSMRIKQLQQQLKNNQSTNQKDLMTQSTKLDSPGGSENSVQVMGTKKFASLPRFKKIDFSPLKLKINNVLQRNNHQPEF
ncbi:scrambled [Haematobia irritans]|uniref:scrambled n=1 Tax=Haematobia irritans TaxID=7368 RepID=UPI003F50CA62